jgi:diaminopropionate ammonia-lyase
MEMVKMMNKDIKWALNKNSLDFKEGNGNALFGQDKIDNAVKCFSRFTAYKPTPLYKLENLSEKLGIGGLFVKDESLRLELKSFKVLGGFYAISKYLAKKLNMDMSSIDFNEFKSEENRKKTGDITFTCATDGNHGFGVAWTAKQLNQKAVIYMPKGSSANRVEYIESTGAKVIVTDRNYDDTVRIALSDAEKNGWVIIQDTAWEGYRDIPCSIMQGYSIIAEEALKQMKTDYGTKPSHIFVQAGVGALAAAIIGYFASAFPENPPIMAVVEPEKADCVYQSMKAGELTKVSGDLNTIMAGLACGETNPIAWEIISRNCSAAISVPDYITEEGMRILAKPVKNDHRIVSGESGAVTTGLVVEMIMNGSYSDLRKALKIDDSSNILVISTEGDTDPDIYLKIINSTSESLLEMEVPVC